jgi:hypothetical protein
MFIDLQGGDKLSFFQDLYRDARGKLEEAFSRLDQHYEQYKGSPRIDGSDVEAKVVRNITYELIESQITGYIPNASVSPQMISEKNIRNAKSIEKLMSNIADKCNFTALNDMDERYTYIYGGSIFLVEWDNSIRSHSTIGDIKVTNISPKKFTPQPNLFDINDMEYCFVEFETTKEDIVRKYGVEPSIAEDAADEEGEDDNTATIYVCYYKDDNGNVCEYVWSGDTELLDMDDFYSRKTKVCKKCGKKEGLCTCEKSKFELQSEEYEELTRDVVIEGKVIVPMYSEVVKDGKVQTNEVERPAIGADGQPVLTTAPDGSIQPVIEKYAIPKLEPTKLPFYKPNRLPIVIRKNTSQEESLLGQSDCDFIRPQQQAINKVESRILEKLLKGGVVPTVPDDYEGVVTDGVFDRVMRLKPGQQGLVGRIDLQPNVQQDVMEAERLYDHAKRLLGISDSFQGQYDSSAQSGKAKQLQIQQASGRLDSKRRMKNAAYADIYGIIFQLYLAYADEPRPVSYKDANGNRQNIEFNRFAFIERDEAGEWYYNDSYIFEADASVDIEKNREYMWEQNRLNYQSGAYGDLADPQTQLIFWQNMEQAHYPFAHDNVERLKEAVAQRIAQMQMQIGQLQEEVNNRAGYEEYLKAQIGGQAQ